MLKEFREFAFKGNMIDLAVGLILGAAFGTVVTSLVSDVIMPVFGMLGTKDFSNLYVPLTAGQDLSLPLEEARKAGPVIAYGLFLNKFISFLVISFVIFLIVKKVMSIFKKEKQAQQAAPTPSREEVLLAEIRDLLKQRS